LACMWCRDDGGLHFGGYLIIRFKGGDKGMACRCGSQGSYNFGGSLRPQHPGHLGCQPPQAFLFVSFQAGQPAPAPLAMPLPPFLVVVFLFFFFFFFGLLVWARFRVLRRRFMLFLLLSALIFFLFPAAAVCGVDLVIVLVGLLPSCSPPSCCFSLAPLHVGFGEVGIYSVGFILHVTVFLARYRANFCRRPAQMALSSA
jgi:hypothetical protein